MSHLMASGKTCGRKDDHNGQCLSEGAVKRGHEQSVERKRRQLATPEGLEAHRERSRKTRATLAGREASNEYSRRNRATPEGREYQREATRRYNQRTGYIGGRRRRARLRGCMQEDLTKRQLCERQGWRCYICGCDLHELTTRQIHVEHIIHLAAPGLEHIFRRLAASCGSCNNGAGGKWQKLLVPYLLERQAKGLPVHEAYVHCINTCPLFATLKDLGDSHGNEDEADPHVMRLLHRHGCA